MRRAGAEVGYRTDGDRSAAADCVLGNGDSSVFRGIDYPYTSDSGMAVIESDGVSYSGNFYRHKAVEYGEIAGKQNNSSDSDCISPVTDYVKDQFNTHKETV